MKEIETKFVSNEFPLTYRKFKSEIQKLTKNDIITFKPLIDKLKINSEILYLLESENQNMPLEVALYFISLKYLSNQNE